MLLSLSPPGQEEDRVRDHSRIFVGS